MSVPQDLSFSRHHEWLRIDDGVAVIGVTGFAVQALGDVVFVGLPEVGQTLTADEVCGEIESTKSVSDLYSPASGEVVEVNQALLDDPAVINSDPYGAGWLFRLRPSAGLDLLDAAGYAALTEEG